MLMKPYRAFGLVFMINYHYADERYKNMITSPDCTIFCSRGRQHVTDLSTGERVADVEPGTLLTPEAYSRGFFQVDVVEDSTIYCYDPKLNFDFEQRFNALVVDGGAQTIIRKGSRILLCEGSLEISGQIFDAPARIHVESGDKLATAMEAVFGMVLL